MALYTYHTLQDAADATGNGTNLSLLDPSLGYAEMVTLQVSGTFSGTVAWEGSMDGTNYVAISMYNITANSTATTATTTGIFRLYACPLRYFRARVSAYTSGAITVNAGVFWR